MESNELEITTNSDELNNKNKKPISKKTIASIIFLLAITIVVFIVFFSFNDINETIELIKTVDPVKILIAVVCLILYAAIWPVSLCMISRRNKIKTSLLDDYFIGGSEFFFNNITPFSSGGQPVQIYLYTQKKVSASQSTGIILANFIVLMFASNIFALASLIYYGRFSQNFSSGTSWMIVLGFIMNLFTLVFMILIATSSGIRKFFRGILELLCKNKFIAKYLAKSIPAFDTYCENAQAATKEIFSHKITFIFAIIVRMISLLFYYAIPYYILGALGVDVTFEVMPYIILASAFAITTMVWVPTPGGTGGIEFAFTTIFTTFAGVTTAIGAAGMVLWRALTYYLLTILSLVCYIVFEFFVKKLTKKAKDVEKS